MNDKIHLKVITHEKIVYEDYIDELYVQAIDGSLGILKNHLPIICALKVGVAKVVKEKMPQCIAIMGGILQFANNSATILTDVAELECDIDVARARQAKIRAEARLRARDENIDMARVQVALAKAIARISAKDKHF
ncbi:MAG: ATP synthase F1 subunit epsilon [Candidatus Gastranaerophilales bacterium]|nr:ATP synthase F1 subunit epsilon [Candidatus Gastranaerophilales bacterium]